MKKEALTALKHRQQTLSLENALLKTKSELLAKTIQNSLAGFTQSLMGQSNLTSFNPIYQNNIYAPATINWTMLMYMYKTHGIIQTAIDMPVLDALRGGLELHSDQLDQDDLSEIEDKLEEDGIMETIGDAFIWARLFGGGALIINSEADRMSPLEDDPLDGQLEFYDACRWELGAERRIPANGKYNFYGKELDQSRVMTIVGKRAPFIIRNQLSDWGMSEIERMIEDFNNYIRNRNVIYELLNEAKVDVYKLKNLNSQLASSTGTNLTVSRVQFANQIKNFSNALVLDKEDDYEQKQVTFAGLADMMVENRIGIASALRMPLSKIFGISAAGFNSGEDDIENYNAMVESEVRQPMKKIIRTVLRLIVKNLHGEDLDINFKFKPLRILSAKDEEDIKRSKSDRYLAMFDRMLINSKEVGEMCQKDNLAPIALEAEKGLLDDHPVNPAQVAGEDLKDEKYAPSPKTESGTKQNSRRPRRNR